MPDDLRSFERYQGEILGALLDKYEGSSFFKTGAPPTRRIMLKLYDSGVSDFPAYDIEKTETREGINRAVLALHEANLVAYQWMKGEDRHILAKAWLNFENIASAYDFLRRRPANDIADEACLELLATLNRVRSDWMRNFLKDCYEHISRKRSIGKGKRLPEDQQERQNLLKALAFADSMGETELLERVFSIQCFGDSKTFESTVKKRFLEIIRRYADFDDDSADEDLLRFAGITRYPEQFEFRGPLSIAFDSETAPNAVDFSPLVFGASLNSRYLRRGTLQLPPDLTAIISIENRANYIDHISRQKNEHELAVYHGGQFSPAKALFLKALAKAMPSTCAWRHWGDIDYGGFSMLARLRREIRPDIQPNRMGREELASYARLAAPTTPPYREKLRGLLLRPELADCRPCIEHMVERGVRLEQEAMLGD